MARKSAAKTGSLITLNEAGKLDVKYDEPTQALCEWCKKQLEPFGVVTSDGRVIWLGTRSCDCDGAADQAKREEEARQKQQEQERRASLIRCGVKPRYLDANITVVGIANYLNTFDYKSGRGLYISGPSRAGKTYAASALAKAFHEKKYSIILISSLSMLDAVKASFDGDTKIGIVKFCACDILLIDDLGKENGNSWVMTTLFQVINERYENMLPTIVTTQYEPDTLIKRMSRQGEYESAVAIVERLKETCDLVRLPARKK